MIKFNQLSITPDGRKMIIDVMVKDHDFLKDVYLDSIIIDAGDTYTQGGPSTKPYLVRKFRWEDSMDKPKKCCSLLIKNSHVILKHGYIYKYTGEEIKPCVAVVLGGELLRENTDYTIEYSNNTNPGLGTIKIIGKGQFKGERTKVFDIVDFDKIYEGNEEKDSEDLSIKDNIPSSQSEDNESEDCDCGCELATIPADFDPKNVKIKRGRIVIDWQDMVAPMHNSLFFVYAKAKGTPTADAPCGKDNVFTLGIAVNLYPVYNSFICALKELDSDCNVPKNVIDMYLRYFAFNINVKTGHYIDAIRIWDRWFKPLTRNFKHHHHGIMADIYPNHAYTHGHHPVRDYQAHNHAISHHHHHNDIHYHLPHGYFDFDYYWFYGMPFDPFNPIHHHHIHHHNPDEFHQDEYGHRYWEHEHVDMPVSLELFGGPFNTNVGFYNTNTTIGGCNCGK